MAHITLRMMELAVSRSFEAMVCCINTKRLAVDGRMLPGTQRAMLWADWRCLWWPLFAIVCEITKQLQSNRAMVIVSS